MDIAVFRGRIEKELDNIAKSSDRARSAFEKSTRSNDDMYLDGTALNILHVYGGAEKVFLIIAETIDQHIPQGMHWHHDLLMQMAGPFPGLRQPVIAPDTLQILDEFRAFRHVSRNVYAFNLNPEKIGALIEQLPALTKLVTRDLLGFLDANQLGKE